MKDEEKAEEYAIEISQCKECRNCSFCWKKENEILPKCEKWEWLFIGIEKGLAEGKPKWHDLRKAPNDLPKENVQIVFYIKEYFKSIEKYKNHYCLGVYKKSFLNDDVKLFVERSKGYECEHSTEDVLYWCELPEFKE